MQNVFLKYSISLLLLFPATISYGQEVLSYTPIHIPNTFADEKVDSLVQRKPLFAIKSNLLFDLACAPNVELEVPIGRRWSVNAEYQFPWWLKKDNSFAFQLLSGGLEGRYWLGSRTEKRVMTGHFIGLYSGIGLYDFQFNKTEGYQGDFYMMGGVSYGYAFPVINDNFSLEFSIGLGYIHTKYKHYDIAHNATILVYKYTAKYDWLGPTKAKVTFSWLINKNVRK